MTIRVEKKGARVLTHTCSQMNTINYNVTIYIYIYINIQLIIYNMYSIDGIICVSL